MCEGDRVRKENLMHLFDKDAPPYLYGTIIREYTHEEVIHANLTYKYDLYDVRWDNGAIGEAFLPNSLERVS